MVLDPSALKVLPTGALDGGAMEHVGKVVETRSMLMHATTISGGTNSSNTKTIMAYTTMPVYMLVMRKF